tara:strand:+ start:85 stop:759 length:675 start_codon:yes stop_codon:yes gene_type:complete
VPTGYESGKTWSPIGAQATVSGTAASRVWTLNEVAAYEGADSWPAPQLEGFEKIGSTNAGGSTSVTFTGIDSTKYQTYMVVWKTINTTTTLDNRVRLNGTDSSSGNIYQSNWYYVSNSSDYHSNSNAETYPMLGGAPKGSSDDQVFSQTWISGPSLAGTGKPMYQFWGSLNDGSNIRNGLAYNTAFSTIALTNATTEITVNNGVDAQTFPAGTIVSAYGYRLNA